MFVWDSWIGRQPLLHGMEILGRDLTFKNTGYQMVKEFSGVV